MSTESDLKRQVEARLDDQEVPKPIWDYLGEKYYLTEAQEGRMSPEEVAQEAQKLMALAPGAAPIRRRVASALGFVVDAVPSKSLDERLESISLLVASHAREDQIVQAFRREVLQDQLMDLDDVESWVEARAEANKPPTPFVRFPVMDGGINISKGRIRLEKPTKVDELPPGSSIQVESLSYAIPDSSYARILPVKANTELFRLARLGKSLAKRYRWQDAQATVFLLTDLPPLVQTLTVSTEMRYPIQTLGRIIIEADPTMPPKTVADAYREARSEILRGRPRAISKKHVELVLFCDGQPNDETWSDRMDAWNEAHPDWTYSEVKNFIRDANQGLRRLLGPSFKFVSKGGK